MRFLNISGPGVMKDDECCPNGHVLLDSRDGYKVCHVCDDNTRQGAPTAACAAPALIEYVQE